ncbi:MAG: 30S ribosomal protein S6 [Candidatus Omnitrophota bacterium]
MNNYEAMFVVKGSLAEDQLNLVFKQIQDAISKNTGANLSAEVWSAKKKLAYPIKGSSEGTYYLARFTAMPSAMLTLKQIFLMNENILRSMILRNTK